MFWTLPSAIESSKDWKQNFRIFSECCSVPIYLHQDKTLQESQLLIAYFFFYDILHHLKHKGFPTPGGQDPVCQETFVVFFVDD